MFSFQIKSLSMSAAALPPVRPDMRLHFYPGRRLMTDLHLHHLIFVHYIFCRAASLMTASLAASNRTFNGLLFHHNFLFSLCFRMARFSTVTAKEMAVYFGGYRRIRISGSKYTHASGRRRIPNEKQ